MTTAAATRTFSGPTYPLLRELRNAQAEIDRLAREQQHLIGHMYQSHRDEGVSDQSVFRADGSMVGPAENYQHLASQSGYVLMSARTSPTDILRQFIPDAFRRRDQARARVSAAEDAIGLVAVILAIVAANELIEWDTDESVVRAAWRISLDAAADLYPRPSANYTPSDVFVDALNLLDCTSRPADEYAARWLSERQTVLARLAELGIEFGGRPLSSSAAAERVGVAASTWRAYVARDQAPKPDLEDGMWHQATVDAYRVTTANGRYQWCRSRF